MGDRFTRFGIILKLLKTIHYQTVSPPRSFEEFAKKVEQYCALVEAGIWDSYYSSSATESTGSEIDSVLSSEMSAAPTEPTGNNTTNQATEPTGGSSKPTPAEFTLFYLENQEENMYENKWKDEEEESQNRPASPPLQL